MAKRRTSKRKRRPPPRRNPQARLLVLCEGRKTEPIYFDALKRELDLKSVRLKRHAWAKNLDGLARAADEELAQDRELDELWCVADHDGRDQEVGRLMEWRERTNKRRLRTKVNTIISVPCFEYWLLLHFRFTTRRFAGIPGSFSACDQVIGELEKYLNPYEKGDPETYYRCRDLLPKAIERARRPRPDPNSSRTDVWRLVVRLEELTTGPTG